MKKRTISKNFDLLTYEEDVQTYTASQDVDVFQHCNGFTAVVTGSDQVFINGHLMKPSTTPLTVTGDSYSVGGNRGEIYVKRRIRIQFVTTVNPIVEIIQKYYTNIENQE